jgi:tryptophanyl-tRNA synthetase
MKNSKTLLTGLQPTGHLMIGNYIGAIRNCVRLQDDYECFLMLADLHAITITQQPENLRQRCMEFIALYLACGIDPDRSTVFVQSHIPGHSQLACILNNFTGMGELQRMTQYKDKAQQNRGNVNAGLFCYPVLMASDILLYNTDLVPVGDDQKQHLELARNIAQRVNARLGDVFTVPEAYVPETGARIMSLQSPLKKMSKSDPNPDSYIALLDSPDIIVEKLKRAVTDSGSDIRFAPEEKPGVSNLLTLYSCVTGMSIEEIEGRYAGRGYGHLKLDLAEHIIELLKPIQDRYRSIITDEGYLSEILADGAAAANHRAEKTINQMNERLGFIPNKRISL